MSHWIRQLKDSVKKKCKGILTISEKTLKKDKADLAAPEWKSWPLICMGDMLTVDDISP